MAYSNAKSANRKIAVPGVQETFTRYRTPIAHVKRGMYVAELDRPWLDTPFLMQGFVVDSQEELSTLREYCNEVFVELERSRPEIHDAIIMGGELVVRDLAGNILVDAKGVPIKPAGAPAASRSPVSAHPGKSGMPRGYARDDDRQSKAKRRSTQPADQTGKPTRPGKIGRAGAVRTTSRSVDAVVSPQVAHEQGPSLWQRMRSALGSLFSGSGRGAAEPPGARLQAVPQALRKEIERSLPAGERLTEWTDTRPIEEELPRARIALDRGEKVLATMFSDIRQGRIPQVEQVTDAMTGVAESMIENPDALLWVAHLRDKHTRSYRHAMRVALYMVAMGRQLGFPRAQLAKLGTIGLLADIGKTKVPQALLDKPGMLTPAEFDQVKGHVALGVEMLGSNGKLSPEVLSGIVEHHERLDGSGYPNRLSGSEIGIYGRMAAIADSFAAMTSSRPYGSPVAPHAALMHLFEWAGKSFHESLVEQFVQALGVFPVGSLIELTSGEVAVVLAHNRARRLEPRVLLLTDTQREPLSVPREFDLISQKVEAGDHPVRIRCGLPAGAYGLDPASHYANALQPSSIDGHVDVLAAAEAGDPAAPAHAARAGHAPAAAAPAGATRAPSAELTG